MLNRRLLRSKAVQALYAIRIATDSNRLLANDEIAEVFLPDLNSMLPQNLEKLEGLKRLAILTLNDLVETGEPGKDEELPYEAVQTARRAFETMKRQNQKDKIQILNRILKETEGLYDQFLYVLMLLVELAHQATVDRDRKLYIKEGAFPSESGLDDNTVVLKLKQNEAFELAVIRSGVNWGDDMAVVRRTYREVLRADENYIEYCKKNVHTAEEDQQLVQHLLRQVILKHEIPLEYFQQKDLYWEEHADLIKSMAIKTLKSATNGPIELSELTDDWDEDRFFVEELVGKALENDKVYEGYLHEQLKNWDIERIALVDMIIMKAALTEMIHFPSIPVKVTINEFIEIAKRYSTLKSGKFVNGNLDRLAEKLKEEGVIRKSGRGLIDNR